MPRSTDERVVPDSARVLGEAIRRAYRQAPNVGKQTVLGDLLGLDQTAVSKIVTGITAVTLERVAEIEDVCGLPRGQILLWGGAISDEALAPERPLAEVRVLDTTRRVPGARAAKKRPHKSH